MLQKINRRKFVYLGDIMRGSRYEIIHLIARRKIMGNRSAFFPMISRLRNLREWSCHVICSLFQSSSFQSQDSHNFSRPPQWKSDMKKQLKQIMFKETNYKFLKWTLMTISDLFVLHVFLYRYWENVKMKSLWFLHAESEN